MPEYSPEQWAAHLRSAAGVVPGHRTVVWPPAEPGLELPEADLWRALDDAAVDVERVLGDPTHGPLWRQGRFRTIEVWTEAELCGLHALWGLARVRERDDWARHAERVRDWHLEHTQPDNATNRPWAFHVFLLAGSREGQLYAETLLHNCMVTTGHPDPFSAWILLDSARWLELTADS